MGTTEEYPDELIERAVRLALESGRPMRHIAADLGLPNETLRRRVRQAEAAQGSQPLVALTAEQEEIPPRLRRERTTSRRSVGAATETDAPVERVWAGLKKDVATYPTCNPFT